MYRYIDKIIKEMPGSVASGTPVLSCIIQRINYMFRPLLGHNQVVPILQGNCIT